MPPEYLRELYAERYGPPVRTDRPRRTCDPEPISPQQAWRNLSALRQALMEHDRDTSRPHRDGVA